MANFTNFRIGRKKVVLLRTAIFFSFVFSAVYFMYASTNGITGQTNQGCDCHSQNSNTTVSSSSQSGTFTVQPGSTNTFTITVSNSSYNYFGVDIAVKTTSNGSTNAGTLAPVSGSGLQALGGELTHTSPKNGSGSTSFDFTWTAPNTAGTYYLKAAGNAVNNNNQDTGDQWAFMSVRSITVASVPTVTLSAPAGSENFCAGASTNITWTASSVTNVKIELSNDGGSSYTTTLVASTAASAGSWSWNIPSGQSVGNQYRIKISDASNSTVNSASGNFSIAPATAITSQPQASTICSGQQAQMSVTATGNALTYNWKLNGNNVPNGTGATLTINNVQTTNAGTYYCIVTGACGSPVTSSSAVLTVNETPTISQQPIGSTVCENQPVSLSVTATGTNIQYQWRLNSQPITNATSSTLLISSAKLTDAGNYDCVVSGLCLPAATSAAANVVVNTATAIVENPRITNLCEGNKGLIYVVASGAELSYIWQKDGVDIPSTNNDTLIFSSAKLSDAGSYSVKVTGKCGNQITSTSAALAVYPLPILTGQPSSSTVVEGSTLNLSVVAAGFDLKYQWRKNNTALSGKTETSITINNIASTDSGKYDCVVTNSCGSITSNQATIKVTSKPVEASLSILSSTVNFGNVKLGSQKDTVLTAFISNSGGKDLIVTDIAITGDALADFSLLNAQMPITLTPGEKKSISIRFKPSSKDSRAALATVKSNSISGGQFSLLGFGSFIELTSSVSELSLIAESAGKTGTGKISLKNSGNIDVTCSSSIVGSDASVFKLDSPIGDFVLKAGASVEVSISFNPISSAKATANLNITTKEDGVVHEYALNGSVSTSVIDETISAMSVYPNPSNGMINIEVSSNSNTEIYARIIDELGNNIKNLGKIYLNSGKNNIYWDKQTESGLNVSSGSYMLIIESGSEVRIVNLRIID